MATRVELVEEAQSKIKEALKMLRIACKDDENAKAYIVDHLRIMAGSGHGFCTRDMNLDDLIERYEGNDEDVGGDELIYDDSDD